MVKTLKNLLLQNRWVDCLETCYVALGDWVLASCSNGDPKLTLTFIFVRVKFGPLGFWMEERWKVFFQNNGTLWYERRCFMNTKSHSDWMFINIFKPLLPWNIWSNFNKILFAASWQYEDLRFVQIVMIIWSTWPPCPYMVKTLKHLLLQNHLADCLETWYVVSIDRVLLNFFQMVTLCWAWPIFVKVKFGPLGYWMGKRWNIVFFQNSGNLWYESRYYLSSVNVSGQGHSVTLA